MKKYRIIWIALLIIVVLGYWFYNMRDDTELSEEDRLARQDDKVLDGGSPPQDVELFPDTPVGKQLRDHMMVLAMPAPTIEEADGKYMASMAVLRKNPGEVVKLVHEAYGKIDEQRYFNRWGLVKILGDLESTEASKPLADIATSKIPTEKSTDLHHFSTQEEEVIIRVRAVEGLGALAQRGDKPAEEVLLKLALDSSNSAIQLRAIKGFLRAGKNTEARVKLLTSKLDKRLHDVITLAVTSPDEFAKRVGGLTILSTEETLKDKSEEQQTSPVPSPQVKQ